MDEPIYKVVADNESVGEYDNTQEIAEKVIESLGMGKKKIYIEEVNYD